MSSGAITNSVLAIALSTTAVAAESYRCDLKEVFSLTGEGTWEKHALSNAMIAQQVIVDRKSGIVYHPHFGNESYVTRHLLDEGSSHSSLKVVAYSDLESPTVAGEKPFRNLTVFQVHTYVDSFGKPFVVMTSGSMGTGICN